MLSIEPLLRQYLAKQRDFIDEHSANIIFLDQLLSQRYITVGQRKRPLVKLPPHFRQKELHDVQVCLVLHKVDVDHLAGPY
ncbi:hypothetical protein D3C84_1032320 [compost metagenome]